MYKIIKWAVADLFFISSESNAWSTMQIMFANLSLFLFSFLLIVSAH